MFSFKNISGQFLSALLTLVFTILFSFSSLISGTKQELPQTPEAFTPVLRFAVCSDVHLNGTNEKNRATKFAALFRDAYSYAESCEYKKLDAVLVAGDFVDRGLPEEYIQFNEIVNANIKD